LDLLYLSVLAQQFRICWHPHLEIQTDFLSGQNPSRSAVSMEAKADYPAPLDDEQVQRCWEPEKQQPHHQDIILDGLGNHYAFICTRDERYY
jgi:hypothetical protein